MHGRWPDPIVVVIGVIGMWVSAAATLADEEKLDYRVDLTSATRLFADQMCWIHPRAGILPPGSPGTADDVPTVVMTLQKILLTRSDVFYPLHTILSRDLGATWTEPKLEPAFERQVRGEGIEMTVCDFWPKWHAASGKLLGIGHTVWYRDNRLMQVRPRSTAYAVYDVEKKAWLPWRELEMPDERRFKNAGAGSTQRVDLANGDILLPVYFKEPEAKLASSTIVRCRFDGQTLRYVEHGDELSVDVPRGFGEPSLARLGDRFFLTLRNDQHGYVTSGNDGLHFDQPKKWTFDDGSDLGSYNTQQHWVSHSDGLFLVYTRRGANNDHVLRNRAPLFIAQIDPQRLCVLRATERILVPERGADLGNFGVVDVSPDETWVTTAECMSHRHPEQYASDGSVWVAKIKWNRPNRLAQ
jgi:hypothetical protein